MCVILGTDKVSHKCLQEDRKENQTEGKGAPKWTVSGL